VRWWIYGESAVTNSFRFYSYDVTRYNLGF
jgi:hypothetical protein